MDPITNIKIHKDSSFAMLLAAQKKGWQLRYMEQQDLFMRDGRSWASWRPLQVWDDAEKWFELGERVESPLDEQNVILMRKDPPFDMAYINATYLLELAEARGSLIVNKPQSLRDANEKLFTAHFPQCCAPTLVTSSRERLRAFIDEHQDVVVKPLGLMGGASIFRLRPDDGNLSVILETMTEFDSVMVMAQRYLPEIVDGDKRILLIEGKPVPYALARIPAKGELRGNLAAGGRGEGVPLTERDYWLCEQIGPELKKRGLIFVGLDVIGDYVTEINVTSPTCIRELDAQFNLDIAGDLMNAIEARLSN